MTNLNVDLNVSTIESFQFENASFGYDRHRPIFKDLNFQLPLEKTLLVTGPAGNGHSTFLKLLALLVQPTSGAMKINGYDTTQMSFEEFQPLRRLMSYTFDLGGLFANRTLLDNLTLPLLYHNICSRDEAEDRAKRLAHEFNFASHLKQLPAAASGGLRKTVCILRSLLLEPQMLIMDDPFTGVDSGSCQKLVRELQVRRENGQIKHIVFTSRDLTWPDRLGHDSLVIEHGQPRFHEGEWKAAA